MSARPSRVRMRDIRADVACGESIHELWRVRPLEVGEGQRQKCLRGSTPQHLDRGLVHIANRQRGGVVDEHGHRA